MTYISVQFSSKTDGQVIHGYAWPSKCEPKSLVVISHGMAEHALRYERFAKALNRHGYEVWAVDHRAHGKTSGPKGLGDFGEAGWDGLVSDLGQFIDLAREDSPSIPLVLFGHSMGSIAAQQFIVDSSTKIDGLILSGSTAVNVSPGESDSGKSGPPMAPNTLFEPARTPYDWLSRDEAEVDQYINDPMCGFEGQVDGSRGIVTSWQTLSKPGVFSAVRSDLPILFVAGDKDPVNHNLRSLDNLEEQFHEIGIVNINKHYYKDGRHEMLNEVNRDEVTQNIISWLRDISQGIA